MILCFKVSLQSVCVIVLPHIWPALQFQYLQTCISPAKRGMILGTVQVITFKHRILWSSLCSRDACLGSMYPFFFLKLLCDQKRCELLLVTPSWYCQKTYFILIHSVASNTFFLKHPHLILMVYHAHFKMKDMVPHLKIWWHNYTRTGPIDVHPFP